MSDQSTVDGFPLTWPIGWPRTEPGRRQRAPFRQDGASEALGFGRAVHARLRPQLKLLGATNVVISTNVPLRNDGLPYANARQPDDPVVAVYFRVKGQPRVMACDRWKRIADNVAAIAKTIEALRGIGRWGASSIEQALGGYKALTAAEARKPWWEVLGVSASAGVDEIEACRRGLARRHHPDTPGGSVNRMAEINAAADEGLRAVGATP